MLDLFLYNRKVETVFELLGTKEDDISYSFAWCLKSSPVLLDLILTKILNRSFSTIELKQIKIMLQATEKQKGRTDFEIMLANEFAIIVEAKKGWLLPEVVQLERYAQRNIFLNVKTKLIVSLSECKQYYADSFLPKIAKGVSVKHFSFFEVSKLLKQAKQKTKGLHEKNVLEQFHLYLNKVYRMQKLDSNYVYVVSLGSGFPENWKASWIDIVAKENKYFHPVGRTWPHEPPNYIAFRYNGILKSVHHIKSYDVTNNLSKRFPKLTSPSSKDHEPHFIYDLGPAFTPTREVKTGKGIFRNGRVWCMLDALFTSETIYEAFLESKRRWEIMQNQ